MSVIDVNAVKKQGLELLLNSLSAQLLAAYGQLSTTLGAIEATKLKQEIERIEKEMDIVNQQLTRLEDTSNAIESRHQRRRWEEMLPHIDYRQAWNQFRTIYDDYVDREAGGAALILLPECETMCANLLTRRIYKQLQEEIGYSKVKHIPLEILDHNQLTGIQLLHRLGSYFNCALPQNESASLATAQINAHAAALITTMCNALERDQLLLIELTVAPGIYQAEAFLAWFLDIFWSSLVRKLSAVVSEQNRPKLKCMVVVSADAPLPAIQPFSERYCRAEEYCDEHKMKFVSLTLSNWTEEDIRSWLRRYSGFGEHWDEPTVHKHASSIYGRSRNGVPALARNHLADLLTPFALST